jgi:hypothetical protein
MQTPGREQERRIPAYEKRNADVASELREILGMTHLWVVNADGKRAEPDPPKGFRDRAAVAREKAALEEDEQIRQGFIQIAETLERMAAHEEKNLRRAK